MFYIQFIFCFLFNGTYNFESVVRVVGDLKADLEKTCVKINLYFGCIIIFKLKSSMTKKYIKL